MATNPPEPSFSTSLALHSYDHWELIRNSVIFSTVSDTCANKHMKESRWNWESNIELNFQEVSAKLGEVFDIIHSEQWSLNTNLTFVLKTRAASGKKVNSALGVVDLKIREDYAEYTIYADRPIWLQNTEDLLKTVFRAFKTTAANPEKFCSFRFHHHTAEGIESRTRELEAVGLSDIKANYTPDVYTQVEQLINLSEPFKAGKIILYHGPPGNGKTHLLRAIAYEWSKKFDVQAEVVIDPEPLFEQPGYLMELLTLSERSDKKPKFRFVIAEDCANLFGANCRESSGFGRLLNVVDGLLGAGQKLIFLFTANEQIEEIDPAILRPGRCLQHLHIPDWNRKEATAWLVAKKCEDKIPHLKDTNSLADLYALANNVQIYTNRKENFGFSS